MYEYTFDNTPAGDYRVPRLEINVVQEALKLLASKLQEWNKIALEHGAFAVPYSRELEDVQQMIDYGEEQVETVPSREIVFKALSISSFRYLQCASIYAARSREQEISNITATWPDRVVEAMRGKVRSFIDFANKVPLRRSPNLRRPSSRSRRAFPAIHAACWVGRRREGRNQSFTDGKLLVGRG